MNGNRRNNDKNVGASVQIKEKIEGAKTSSTLLAAFILCRFAIESCVFCW